MITTSFYLPVKPFSVNATYYRDRRHKTIAFKAWENEVKGHLKSHKQLQEIADEFANKGGTFRIELAAVYPTKIFYNSFQQISARTMDVSNFEKPIIDMIFLETMEVDDRFITECKSMKKPGDSYGMYVTLELNTKG